MQYLFDHRGTRYLDLIGGISSIAAGHCHPRITKAIQDQADRLVHSSSMYMNETNAAYAKALSD